MIRGLFREVKRAFKRPAANATPLVYSNFMQTTTGAFYLGGGTVGLLVAVLMAPGPGVRAIPIAIASFSIIAGLTMVQWGTRMSRSVSRVMLFLGSFLIGGALLAATDPYAAIAFSVLFVLVATDAALFCAPLEATVYVAIAVTCNVATLAWRPELAWWAGIPGAVATICIGTSTLVLAGWAANADIDGLTGLLNRRGFDRALFHAIAGADPNGIPPAVVFFDIDHFKRLNDVNGHSYGDQVLVDLARTWESRIPNHAKLARYGGDEFALLLRGISEEDVVALAENLLQATNMRCSAGATSWVPGESSSLMTGRADVALYRAKNSGRNRVMLESGRWTPIAAELSAALGTSLQVAFQPIVRLDEPGNPVVAVEALVRWRPASNPDLNAEQLIEIAEASGIIFDLDTTVLRTACTQGLRLQEAFGAEPLSIHVNASGLTLANPRYVAAVKSVLTETGWPATQLVVEVTETVVDADNAVALNSLAKLREAGVSIAIDDFGTGYSSLSRLQSLPADEIKLDGAFVAASSKHGSSLLETVAMLGRALHMATIAERVETEAEARLLTELGYPMAQGFYFGVPMSCEDLVAVFEARVRTKSLN